MDKKEGLLYIRQLSLIIIALTLLLLPILALTNTTDLFVFPKQMLIIFSSVILLVLFSIRLILERRITLLSAPLNLPMLLFGSSVLLSSIFSPNMYDSMLQSIPLIMALLFYFVLIHTVNQTYSFRVIFFSYLLGAVIASIVTILQALNIHLFPHPLAESKTFNTLGSSIQLILYLIPPLIISTPHLFSFFKDMHLVRLKESLYGLLLYTISSLFSFIGILISIFHIMSAPQKPLLLPFSHGLQIAFAALSQDTQRLFLSFLLGGGYGTFSTLFGRFKTPAFNLQRDIWNIHFSYSSSYFLELLPTIGILGAFSFLFLFIRLIRMQSRNVFKISILIMFIVSFLIPFSFVVAFSLILLCALFVALLSLTRTDPHVYALTLSLVALKQGFIHFESSEQKAEKMESPYFCVLIALLILAFAGTVGFLSTKLLISDLKFRQSLEQSSLSDGNKTYTLQREAIQTFPYKSEYYRIFSQINLALANNLARSVQNQSASPSAQPQRTIIQLIQQSINTARAATTVAPASFESWYNLAQIYRNLINVGQNAEQFAIISLGQAIRLNPYNPALYIDLGGIYYQLGNYELAQQQFQIAANLKRDFANAYYNLGHALEAKGDLKNALTYYQITRNLVQNNKPNYEKIVAEIDALTKKIGEGAQQTQQQPQEALSSDQPPLELATPSANLPPQPTKVQIAPPTEEATKSAR